MNELIKANLDIFNVAYSMSGFNFVLFMILFVSFICYYRMENRIPFLQKQFLAIKKGLVIFSGSVFGIWTTLNIVMIGLLLGTQMCEAGALPTLSATHTAMVIVLMYLVFSGILLIKNKLEVLFAKNGNLLIELLPLYVFFMFGVAGGCFSSPDLGFGLCMFLITIGFALFSFFSLLNWISLCKEKVMLKSSPVETGSAMEP
jgi:hypothetical protein